MGYKVFGGAATGGSFIFRELFQMLTTTLLSLLFPLSFLILARLAIARAYLLFADVSFYPNSLLVDLFLNANSTLLHAMVPLVAIAALTHGLNGRFMFVKSEPAEPVWGPRLYWCWILLCTLQVCVGLGIEGSIAAHVGGSSIVNVHRQKSLLNRALFFLGLHETMLFWSKKVVKPVVDDTIFGFSRPDRWVDKAAMAVSFGFLWWWKLREEVEALVVVAEVKRDLSMGVGVTDFVGWWLYYLTITIGMVKVVKTAIRLPLIFFHRRLHGDGNTVSLHNWRVTDNV